MNKYICAALFTAAALVADAQSAALPYACDLGENYGIHPDWTHVNNGRRAKGFEYDRNADFTTPGTSGGVCHNYDMDYAANCWLFSPTFDLKAGVTYTVGIWAKTKDTDAENFKVCYGADKTASAMTTTLFDKPNFKSADDFTHIEQTFTVESDQSVVVGIQCYSDANSYVLSLTGFTLTGSDSEGGDEPGPVTPDAYPLPFEYSFNNQTDFAANWTSYAGPDAYTSVPWDLNLTYGWAAFDYSEYEKEDNYLISPLLAFTEAGSYTLSYTGLISGKLEFMLGTDAADMSTFTTFATEEADSYDSGIEYTYTLDVAEPGSYRIAIHAAADAGSFMGYRVRSLAVRSDKAVPALVADLTAVPDADDQLEVNLMWTNPSVDHKGNPLQSITKLELYRNGEMIKDDFMTLTPGGINAWLDTPAEAGSYSYHVVAYNANGCAGAPARVVNAGYVGRPVATLPYSFTPESAGLFDLFTVDDANGDGIAWTFVADDTYSWLNKLEIKPEEATPLDDYLITPYFHLAAGYYALTFSANMRNNSLEFGYVTNRHNPAETFVKFADIDRLPEYSVSDRRMVFVIDQAGDYALAVHAVGQSANTTDLTIGVKKIALEAATQLPTVVTSLKAVDLEPEEGFAVELTWVNPTTDNAGRLLAADTQLTGTVSRNGTVIATVDGADCIPGAAMTFTDTDIAGIGNYSYTVAIASANGASEQAPAAVDIYIGPSVALPYATSDFSLWQFADPDNDYNWEVNSLGQATWEKSWGHSKYSIFTPYLRLEAGKEYKLLATFDGHDSFAMPMHLVSAQILDEDAVAIHHDFTVPAAAVDHELSLILTAADGASAAAARTEADEPAIDGANVPAGKLVLSFRPGDTGRITLKSFSLSEHSTVGVGTTIAAAQGALTYAHGRVSCPGATTITVSDTAGRIVLSVAADSADLSALRGAGCLIITTSTRQSLKVVL